MIARNKTEIELLEIKRELVRRKLKKSLFHFLKYFWDVIIKEPFVYNWHIEFLCHELEKGGF